MLPNVKLINEIYSIAKIIITQYDMKTWVFAVLKETLIMWSWSSYIFTWDVLLWDGFLQSG